MNIQQIPTSSVIPYARNPRKGKKATRESGGKEFPQC